MGSVICGKLYGLYIHSILSSLKHYENKLMFYHLKSYYVSNNNSWLSHVSEDSYIAMDTNLILLFKSPLYSSNLVIRHFKSGFKLEFVL